MHVKDIKVKDYVFLQGRPCEVLATATVHPGKCGRRCKIVKGRDVLSDGLYTDTFDNGTDIPASFTVETRRCTIIGIDHKGYAIVKGENEGQLHINMLRNGLFDCDQMKLKLNSQKYEAIAEVQVVDIPEQEYGNGFSPSVMPPSRHCRIINFDLENKRD